MGLPLRRACAGSAHRIGRRLAAAACLLAALLAPARPAAARGLQDPPPATLLAQGAYIARAAGCEGCHSGPRGRDAGGRILHTEFGAVSVPNITPDRQTGIGDWSAESFWRAVHDGIGRRGQPLYPVMNYPAFTLMSRRDVDALYAYLMAQPPIHALRQPMRLRFPYEIRASLWLWRALYFRPGSFRPDPHRSAELNRGAYLVEGPGHCGECHTARNAFGASVSSRPLGGGVVAGFLAPNITSDPRWGIGAWSDDALVRFLRTGASGQAVVFGPMSEVVYGGLGRLRDDDLHAVAAFLRQTRPVPDQVRGVLRGDEARASVARGQRLYGERCAACHLASGGGVPGLVAALAGNPVLRAADPRNPMRAMLGGLRGGHGWGDMPNMAGLLDDQAVADITNFLRARWGSDAPLNASAAEAAAVRAGAPVGAGGSETARRLGCPPTGASDIAGALASDADIDLLAAPQPEDPQRGVRLLLARLHSRDPSLPRAELITRLAAAYCPVLAGRPDLSQAQKLTLLRSFPGQALAAVARE